MSIHTTPQGVAAELESSDIDIESEDYEQLISNLRDTDVVDFESGDYRFIKREAIDGILEQELSSDEYVLGCFNADFLADITDWPMGLIKAAQEGEAFAELGKVLIQEGKIPAIAREFASIDGYGQHFGHYDGNELEFRDYLVFKVN